MTRRLLQAVLLGAACLLFLSIATPAVAARSALSLEPVSRLDSVHAFRLVPPTCRIGAGFRPRPCI
jgi:hypothetical protein